MPVFMNMPPRHIPFGSSSDTERISSTAVEPPSPANALPEVPSKRGSTLPLNVKFSVRSSVSVPRGRMNVAPFKLNRTLPRLPKSREISTSEVEPSPRGI